MILGQLSTLAKFGGNKMTKNEMILREISSLRSAMDNVVKRIESLEQANSGRLDLVQPQAEQTDAQSVYTAMLTDTLIESEG